MTPELEKQVVSLIEAAKQAGSDAASFIAQQAPETVSQMLAWETAKACALCVLFAVLVGVFFWFGKFCAKENAKERWSDYPPSAVSYVLSLIFACLIGVSAMRVVKIQIAPKVVILEQVADFARGKQ